MRKRKRVCITANKHQGIGAAFAGIPKLSLARRHNNANIILFLHGLCPEYVAEEMVDVFVNTEFEGGRHANRVNKMSC